ncbi:hypothetical protein [Hymenobacter terrenus]|uniref:hypothetical protein n=1 Tax=Hymenobacter terrenus TaxID=1629124 RepID=UPI000619D044|nr:hypothetical protein [Hymenobacter terrenus]
MTKEQIVEAVQQLPDNFELEDLFERLLFIHRLEQRLEQAAQNDVVSFEEARKRFYPNGQSDAA